MRKLIYYVAASADHFIAEKDGGIDWLEDDKWKIEGEDFEYAEFYATIDTTFMGYRTYEKIMDMDVPFPYTDKKNYVFTSHPDPMPCEEVCFVHTDAISFGRKCKEAEGKDIWLVGGGQLAGAFLKAGLIDELILHKFPLRLFEGIPLFGEEVIPGSARLIDEKKYNNGVIMERWSLR
jgi:dihydrofolate reductase